MPVCSGIWPTEHSYFITHTHTHMHTLGVGKEDKAPDAGHTAHEQASGEQHALLKYSAQPAHEEKPANHLHAAQAIHHTVPQLTKAEVLLRHRCNHGLERTPRCFVNPIILSLLICNYANTIILFNKSRHFGFSNGWWWFPWKQ